MYIVTETINDVVMQPRLFVSMNKANDFFSICLEENGAADDDKPDNTALRSYWGEGYGIWLHEVTEE